MRGESIITMLLGPATAVLALNIYQQRKVLQENFLPILVGMHHRQSGEHHSSSGPVPSVRDQFGVFRFHAAQSVTTAIALGISETAGHSRHHGGRRGDYRHRRAVLAPFLGKLFHITDPVAEGVAIGACSHAVGTSKALEIGKIQGAMSSISLCVCGIITTGLACFYVTKGAVKK